MIECVNIYRPTLNNYVTIRPRPTCLLLLFQFVLNKLRHYGKPGACIVCFFTARQHSLHCNAEHCIAIVRPSDRPSHAGTGVSK